MAGRCVRLAWWVRLPWELKAQIEPGLPVEQGRTIRARIMCDSVCMRVASRARFADFRAPRMLRFPQFSAVSCVCLTTRIQSPLTRSHRSGAVQKEIEND
jgi:hypothetical protein